MDAKIRTARRSLKPPTKNVDRVSIYTNAGQQLDTVAYCIFENKSTAGLTIYINAKIKVHLHPDGSAICSELTK